MPLLDIDSKNRAIEQNLHHGSPNPLLIACPECDHQVSRNALACPKCAAVLRTVERDYTFLCVFLVIAVGFLIGGLWTMYEPPKLLGGDAYNYIVAAQRGAGLIGVGVSFVIAGFGVHFSQNTRTKSVD